MVRVGGGPGPRTGDGEDDEDDDTTGGSNVADDRPTGLPGERRDGTDDNLGDDPEERKRRSERTGGDSDDDRDAGAGGAGGAAGGGDDEDDDAGGGSNVADNRPTGFRDDRPERGPTTPGGTLQSRQNRPTQQDYFWRGMATESTTETSGPQPAPPSEGQPPTEEFSPDQDPGTTVATGVEQSGAILPAGFDSGATRSQASDLEQQWLQNNPGFSASDVRVDAVRRDGEVVFETRLTESGREKQETMTEEAVAGDVQSWVQEEFGVALDRGEDFQITRSGDRFQPEFTQSGRREIARAQLQEATYSDVGPEDITREDGQWTLTEEAADEEERAIDASVPDEFQGMERAAETVATQRVRERAETETRRQSRRQATATIESQLESQTGIDLEPGRDFVVERTDQGYGAELTDRGLKRTAAAQSEARSGSVVVSTLSAVEAAGAGIRTVLGDEDAAEEAAAFTPPSAVDVETAREHAAVEYDPQQDFTVEEVDGQRSATLTEAGATKRITEQLEGRYGEEFTAGEDFEVERTDDGAFRADLTERGQQTVEEVQQRREAAADDGDPWHDFITGPPGGLERTIRGAASDPVGAVTGPPGTLERELGYAVSDPVGAITGPAGSIESGAGDVAYGIRDVSAGVANTVGPVVGDVVSAPIRTPRRVVSVLTGTPEERLSDPGQEYATKIAEAGGEATVQATIGAPAGAVDTGGLAADAAVFTAREVEEQGPVGGLQTSGAAGAAYGGELATTAYNYATTNPARFTGAIGGGVLGGFATGILATRGIQRGVGRVAAARLRRRSDTDTIDFEDITSERGEQGLLPEFETKRGEPTSRAVAELRRRAADQPGEVSTAVGTDRVLYHTTQDRFGRSFETGEGTSELPGLFQSPDASPLRLQFGDTGSTGYRLGVPSLQRQTGRIVATEGDQIRAMPPRAAGSGYAVRQGGEIKYQGLSRAEANRLVDIDGGERVPDPDTAGYAYLTEEAEAGATYVRATGDRTPELEGVTPPGSEFERTGTVAVREGGRDVPIPFTGRSIPVGGRYAEMGVYRRLDNPDPVTGEIADADVAAKTAADIERELSRVRRSRSEPTDVAPAPVTPSATGGQPTAPQATTTATFEEASPTSASEVASAASTLQTSVTSQYSSMGTSPTGSSLSTSTSGLSSGTSTPLTRTSSATSRATSSVTSASETTPSSVSGPTSATISGPTSVGGYAPSTGVGSYSPVGLPSTGPTTTRPLSDDGDPDNLGIEPLPTDEETATDAGPGTLEPGWYQEYLVDVALGPTISEAPSQETLESRPVSERYVGALPTRRQVEAEGEEAESIAAAEEFLTFGSSSGDDEDDSSMLSFSVEGWFE